MDSAEKFVEAHPIVAKRVRTTFTDRELGGDDSVDNISLDKTTIEVSDDFKRSQWRHAFAINVLPLIGTLVAIYSAVVFGLEPYVFFLFFPMYFLTMVCGITVGFHRLLSHQAFQGKRWVESFLVICGCMALQGPPLYWVSNHKRHHRFSDRDGDVHSPHINDGEDLSGWKGFWHAHIGWMFNHSVTNTLSFSKTLMKKPHVLYINNRYKVFAALGLVLPVLLGILIAPTPLEGLINGILWGVAVRLFVSLHATNSVNSVAHLFGSRPYDTGDHSTNNAYLAAISGGETWHNNHHAFPNSAKFGLRWWQVDPGYYVVWLLKKLGLVWNVSYPSDRLMNRKKSVN